MKNEKLEKYIGDLSPELQEKARECKDMQELNALLAENDVELSEDALAAVAGGCSSSEEKITEQEIEKYINKGPNTFWYQGGRCDGAVKKIDNKGNINYYMITVRGHEKTTPEEYAKMIKNCGMVKVL